MDTEVLYVAGLCLTAFVTGRLMVSRKEASERLSRPLFTTMALGCINYVALYDHWLLTGLAVGVAYFFGFAGKDSVKLPMRNYFGPWWRKNAGAWTVERNAGQDEHHQKTNPHEE